MLHHNGQPPEESNAPRLYDIPTSPPYIERDPETYIGGSPPEIITNPEPTPTSNEPLNSWELVQVTVGTVCLSVLMGDGILALVDKPSIYDDKLSATLTLLGLGCSAYSLKNRVAEVWKWSTAFMTGEYTSEDGSTRQQG